MDESKVKSTLADRESKSDIDDEGSERYEIAKLSPRADTITIINKINEIINVFNNSLIDNRI